MYLFPSNIFLQIYTQTGSTCIYSQLIPFLQIYTQTGSTCIYSQLILCFPIIYTNWFNLYLFQTNTLKKEVEEEEEQQQQRVLHHCPTAS